MPPSLMKGASRPGVAWVYSLQRVYALWLMLHALSAPAEGQGGPWSEPRVLAFGERRQWLLVHVPSLRAEPVSLPPGYEPVSLTATRDGRTLVFTSRDASHPQDALFA